MRNRNIQFFFVFTIVDSFYKIFISLIQLFNHFFTRDMIGLRRIMTFRTDTPTAKAHWVLIHIHFQIYSKAYETSEFL